MEHSAALPFSQSCENNKEAILGHLMPLFAPCSQVLEIGSGTGQHATWFARHMPWLSWQPTDVAANLPTLEPRCLAYEGQNLLPICDLDVTDADWKVELGSAVFTANSLHIMPFCAVESLFSGLAKKADTGLILVVYGPFNYDGQYTSPSNARFDQWLAAQHPQSAIRDFERVDALASEAGFSLEADHSMPANNRLLSWRKLR